MEVVATSTKDSPNNDMVAERIHIICRGESRKTWKHIVVVLGCKSSLYATYSAPSPTPEVYSQQLPPSYQGLGNQHMQ